MSNKMHRDQEQFRQAALDYHKSEPKGKIEVIPSKPHSSQRDLSLAYSPGVAEPCLEIEKNPKTVYEYTSKGNLVAVISNGTAVLGLGDIGAEASKPVMEGKGLLFKIFADINVFDIEINEKDPEKFLDVLGDEKFKDKVWIIKTIRAGIIRKGVIGTGFNMPLYFGDIYLGKGLDEAINFLLDKENQNVFIGLKKAYEAYKKEKS